MTYQTKSPYNVRCDSCKRATKLLFRRKIGNFVYTFCSPSCILKAIENHDKNKDKIDTLVVVPEAPDDLLGE